MEVGENSGKSGAPRALDIRVVANSGLSAPSSPLVTCRRMMPLPSRVKIVAVRVERRKSSELTTTRAVWSADELGTCINCCGNSFQAV